MFQRQNYEDGSQAEPPGVERSPLISRDVKDGCRRAAQTQIDGGEKKCFMFVEFLTVFADCRRCVAETPSAPRMCGVQH